MRGQNWHMNYGKLPRACLLRLLSTDKTYAKHYCNKKNCEQSFQVVKGNGKVKFKLRGWMAC